MVDFREAEEKLTIFHTRFWLECQILLWMARFGNNERKKEQERGLAWGGRKGPRRERRKSAGTIITCFDIIFIHYSLIATRQFITTFLIIMTSFSFALVLKAIIFVDGGLGST